MAQKINKNEATADKRRMYLHLVDATDGITPEDGEGGGQPQMSVNGANGVNTSGVLVKIANMPGDYYVQLTQGEIDLANGDIILGTFKNANTAQAIAALIQIEDPDVYKADLTDLEDVALGKWVVDPDANTMTLYRIDGVTPLIVFDLTPATTTGPGHIARTPQ